MQVRFEEEFKMSQHNQIKDDLEVLEIDITQKLTIRYVTLKYKKLAKVVHPDRKGGDKCKLSKPQLNHNSTQPNITLTLFPTAYPFPLCYGQCMALLIISVGYSKSHPRLQFCEKYVPSMMS